MGHVRSTKSPFIIFTVCVIGCFTFTRIAPVLYSRENPLAGIYLYIPSSNSYESVSLSAAQRITRSAKIAFPSCEVADCDSARVATIL